MTDHPIESFRSRLAGFDNYPPDVLAVPEFLPGTAAFAASAGLYRPPGSTALPQFPFGGLMIVGHNLDSWDGYEARRRSGVSHGDVVPGKRTMSTWVGLYKLLSLAGVDREQFFFTNIYVGLKNGRPTGQFTAYKAPEYRQWCRAFLAHQIEIVKPSVVLVLGVTACRDIAAVAEPTPWAPGPLPAPGASQGRLCGHATLLVPAHHTSMPKRITADAAALGTAWREMKHT